MGARHLSAAVATALSAAGCGGCDGEAIGQGGSSIVAEVPLLDFGEVYIGAEKKRSFVLRAPGEIPVDYTSRFGGDAWGYQAGPANGTLGANTMIDVVVTFRPTRPGLARAAVLIDSNATRIAQAAVELQAVALVPPDCEDGNGCTEDHFDIPSERCIHQAVNLPCDDFDLCTTGDRCARGLCLGESVSCGDNDPCTDDFCDPQNGCVHRPTKSCDDENPCTLDHCAPDGTCRHENADDYTPCQDGEQCTRLDVCKSGVCIGVNVPNGTRCDDGEPCSKNETCQDGECLDASYHEPAIGEIKFTASIGRLSPGAPTNPILDRENTVYVGVEGGVAAVDHCGVLLWQNLEVGSPRWQSAVATPGLLSVPIGRKILDIEASNGEVRRTLDLGILFGYDPATTSSTTHVPVTILDLAVRASGALVASVVYEAEPGAIEGVIAEIDRGHSVATRFQHLGPLHASRLAIDRDEAIVAIVADGLPGSAPRRERLVRFGVFDAPGTTWSATGTIGFASELAIGAQSNILWSPGVSVSREGELDELLPPWEFPVSAASPIATPRRVHWLRPYPTFPPLGFGVTAGLSYELVTTTATDGAVVWRQPLDVAADGMSPAVDAAGNVFVLAHDAVLRSFAADGRPMFTTPLPFSPEAMVPCSLTLTHDDVLIVAGADRIVGVKSIAPIAASSWPRHRRDNLATSHR